MKSNYTLQDVSQEQLKAFNDDLASIIEKHGVEIRTIPTFVPTTEGKFVVDANVVVYKKVELIPKEEGVPSPFVENGGNDNGTIEKTKETTDA